MINIKPLMNKQYDEFKYSCWDYCRDVYRINGLGDLPEFNNIDKHGHLRGARGIQQELSRFKPCEYKDGALALMRVSNVPLHIGVCCGGRAIAHLDYERGPVIEFIQDLDIEGYYEPQD